MRTFPSSWAAIAFTTPFGAGVNEESATPAAERCAVYGSGTPPIVVNAPAT